MIVPPPLFPPKLQKNTSRMADPGGRPPVPEPDHRDFLNLGKKERGEVFCFQRLAKAFIGADSRKLKMRRLPPTCIGFYPFMQHQLFGFS
jgi:hypothetical protein